MSYSTIESALATLLQAVTGFSSANVVIGHYRPVASKKASVTLTPGAIVGRKSLGNRTVTTEWVVNVTLFVKSTDHNNVEDIYATIKSSRQALIDQVDKYPSLNGTTGVHGARIEDAGEPDWLRRGDSHIWFQPMRCIVKETVLVSGGEFA